MIQGAELRIDEVFLEENRTMLETSHWMVEVRVTVANRGAAPLPVADVWKAFRIQKRSGEVVSGMVDADNKWWPRDLATRQRVDLPPGAVGHIRIRAQVGDKKTRDDPAAVLAWDARVELR